MARPLPARVPVEIVDLLKSNNWSGLSDFAKSTGLKVSSVYSLFLYGSTKSLQVYKRLADGLSISLNRLVDICLMPDEMHRRAEFLKCFRDTGFDTIKQLEREVGISNGFVRGVLNGRKLVSLSNCKAVSERLGVDLDEFATFFS